MNGVSKKLTVSGIGIAALVAVIKTAQPNIPTYIAEVGIILITLLAIAAQTYLDSINKQKNIE